MIKFNLRMHPHETDQEDEDREISILDLGMKFQRFMTDHDADLNIKGGMNSTIIDFEVICNDDTTAIMFQVAFSDEIANFKDAKAYHDHLVEKQTEEWSKIQWTTQSGKHYKKWI